MQQQKSVKEHNLLINNKVLVQIRYETRNKVVRHQYNLIINDGKIVVKSDILFHNNIMHISCMVMPEPFLKKIKKLYCIRCL